MGIEARRIKEVSGHKSTSSLEHYIRKPTLEEKVELSSLLHRAAPGKMKLKIATDVNPASTSTCLPLAPGPPLSATQPNSPSASPAFSIPTLNTSNTLSTMFAGVTFSNATININWKSGQ